MNSLVNIGNKQLLFNGRNVFVVLAKFKGSQNTTHLKMALRLHLLTSLAYNIRLALDKDLNKNANVSFIYKDLNDEKFSLIDRKTNY